MGFALRARIDPSIRDPKVVAELARLFLRAVVATNRVEMRMARAAGRPFPKLYESNGLFFYEREPKSAKLDDFSDAATVLRRAKAGIGSDCEDLSAYRVAELQEEGETDADIRIYWRRRQTADGRWVGPRTMHVEVRRGARGNNEIEDPSRLLGM